MTRTLPEIDMDISVALRGAADLFAERAKAQIPPAPVPTPTPPPDPAPQPDPTPTPPPVVVPPSVALSCNASTLTPDAPSCQITATLSASADKEITVEVQTSGPPHIIGTQPEGQTAVADIVIPAGSTVASTVLTVTQFGDAPAEILFSVFQAPGATFDTNAVWHIPVAAKPAPPPNPVPPDPAPTPAPQPDPVPTPPVATIALRPALDQNPFPPPLRDPEWPRLKDSFRRIQAIAPELSQAPPKVRPDHPRLLITADNRAELLARFADFPDLAKPIIAAVDNPKVDPIERALCAAAIYVLGQAPGLNYSHTQAEYGTIARQLLLANPALPKIDHGSLSHFLQAFVFDWIYDILTPDERATVIKRFEDFGVVGAGLGNWTSEYFKGYNCPASTGMLLALAFAGDTRCDYVAQHWLGWWMYGYESARDLQIPSLSNRAFEKYTLGGLPAMREGGTYYDDNATWLVIRRAYETATGDVETLRYPFYEEIPQFLAIGMDGSTPPKYGANYSADEANQFAVFYPLCTGNSDPVQAQLSRWLHDRSGRAYATTGSVPGSAMIVRMLVGNPRVKGKSPGELGLPLTYLGADTWVSRSSWGDDADCVMFSSGSTFQRLTQARFLRVWSKGKLLIGAGGNRWFHGYTPGQSLSFSPTMNVFDGAKCVTKIGTPGSTDSARTTVRGSLTEIDGGAVADYGGWHRVGITDGNCTILPDWPQKQIIVLDQVTCDPKYTVRMTFCTPFEPKWDGGSLTLQNGDAGCVLTFDPPLAECVIRGGRDFVAKPFAQDYDGTIGMGDLSQFTGKPGDAAAESDRIANGGYYTVWLTPAQAGGKIEQKTTVQFR